MEGPRKRRRIPRSCEECRRRKVKCDQKKHCSHCVMMKIRCVYNLESVQYAAPVKLPSPVSHSSAADVTDPQSSGNGVQPDQTVARPLVRKDSPVQSVSIDVEGYVEEHSASGPFHGTIKPQPRLDELNRRVELLERQLVIFASGWNNAGPGRPNQSSVSNIKHSIQPPKSTLLSLNKGRLYGQSHWTNAGHEFRKLPKFSNNEAENPADTETIRLLKSEIFALLHRCKTLGKNLKMSRPSRTSPAVAPSLPEKSIADQMIHLYVTRFESVFRIVHVPSLWLEYEQYWRNPMEAADSLRFKIQLVIAIGSSIDIESQRASELRSAASLWIHAVQNWISGPMEKNRLNISGLQIQCLLILARQCLAIGGDLIWVAMGTVVRTAMQLGLHHDPKHFMKMTFLEAEIRRRLWATIIEMNLQASLDSGMPSTLSFDHFDTEPPSNIDDSDIDDRIEIFDQHPASKTTDTSLQRLLFRYARPRLDILRRADDGTLEVNQHEVLALSTEISKACQECSVHVKKGDRPEEEKFRRNLADLCLRRFLLTLHRPLAGRVTENSLFYFSRKTCFDSATALLSPLPNEEFSSLILSGSGIFKNRMIHVSLALVAELLIEIEEQGPYSSLQQPSSYQKLLIDTLEEARRQVGQRILLGETNVRLHMKLSVALTQATGTETGISLRQALSQSAKDSLEKSYSAIKARLNGLETGSQVDEDSIMNEDFDLPDFDIGFFDFDHIFQATDFDVDEALVSETPFC